MCYQAGKRSRIGAARRKAAMRLRLIDWEQYTDPEDALIDLCVCLDADPDDLGDLLQMHRASGGIVLRIHDMRDGI